MIACLIGGSSLPTPSFFLSHTHTRNPDPDPDPDPHQLPCAEYRAPY